MMEVTPHLKSVLKNYQHSATKSLQGPGFSLVGTPNSKNDLSASSPESKEEELFVPALFPVQQVPILTTPDTSCSECCETILEGESISCFIVGGEKRLCLPQVLKSVLRDFTLAQINQECDQLQIYCSRCTPEQLNVLKNQGILPSVAPSCGLITKTDAERLCSALLYGRQVNITALRHRKESISFPVYHKCFGKARGQCFPELYVEKNAKCIECGDCQSGFSPQQFVCHVHRDIENRTVHWGFDSCNWRLYLHVPIDNPDREQFSRILDEMKEQYDGNAEFPPPLPPPPPPPVVVEPIIKRKQVTAADILKDHELPLKKQKFNEFVMMPYNLQQTTCIQQLYASLDPRFLIQEYMPTAINRHNSNSNPHLSAFKPVVQSIKESKMRHAVALGRYPAPAPPSNPNATTTTTQTDSPVLQNPERVVRLSESERFETSYQPNVALAPPTPKKHRYGRNNCNNNGSGSGASSDFINNSVVLVKKEDAIIVNTTTSSSSSPVKIEEAQSTNKDDIVIESSSSCTLSFSSPSNVQTPSTTTSTPPSSTTSIPPKYNPEIELSTDTEDSASESSSEKQQQQLFDIGKVEDILKDNNSADREKILDFIRNLTQENNRLLEENRLKENKISELELRNTELSNELTDLKVVVNSSSKKVIIENGHHHHVESLNNVTTSDFDDNNIVNDDNKKKINKKIGVINETKKTVIAIVAEQKEAITIKTEPE